MKKYSLYKICATFCLMMGLFLVQGCVENNIGFAEETNIKEGLYIKGSSTEFTYEVPKAKLQELKDSTLLQIDAWLTQEGGFSLSVVDANGKAKKYGVKDNLTTANGKTATSKLVEGGADITVSRDGFYKVVYNKPLNEITVIPYQLQIKSSFALNESGAKELSFDNMSYDKLTHVVTWSTSTDKQAFQATEYMFSIVADSLQTIRLSDTENYQLNAQLTGMGGTLKTNLLTNEYQSLTSTSDIALRLAHKGNYIMSVQYSILDGRFSGKIEGEELIEPEPTNYTHTLFAQVSGNGSATSSHSLELAPVGSLGNGSFWRFVTLQAQQKISLTNTQQGTETFADLDNVVGLTAAGNGVYTVDKSGTYLLYVDLHRKVIALEQPSISGIGECFGGSEVALTSKGNVFSTTTTAEGALQLYATSRFNDRDWNSMTFNIYNDKIVYKGLNDKGFEPVPVVKGVKVSVDVENNKGHLDVTLNDKDVPNTPSAVYLISSRLGNMNWGSQNVQSFQRSFSEKYRWYYIHYFEKGEALRFSTEKVFGRGEFVSLDHAVGFEVKNNKAIIPDDGIYMVYVDLNTRTVCIQPLELYAIGAAVNKWEEKEWAFTLSADKRSMTGTLPANGRLRLNPVIPFFSTLTKPDFSFWKHEMAINPETGEIYYRKHGDPEPNKDYSWKSGTTININFDTLKATITTK